jgi:hypothetical protein
MRRAARNKPHLATATITSEATFGMEIVEGSLYQ